MPTMSRKEIEILKQQAFAMFDQGLSTKYIKATLEIGLSTTTSWKAEWRKINEGGLKSSVEYYQELYPDLPDAMYQALADGKIKASIIRRNFL